MLKWIQFLDIDQIYCKFMLQFGPDWTLVTVGTILSTFSSTNQDRASAREPVK
jgi:hypothetical protein